MSLYYIDAKGYARFTDSGKFVHRWIAGKKLGRNLKPWEVVHHINRDKLDNHPTTYMFAATNGIMISFI